MQLAAAKQELNLLGKDKEFYSKQLCQVETKLRYADDRVIELTEQIEKTKQAREDLFSEYVASRSVTQRALLTQCMLLWCPQSA